MSDPATHASDSTELRAIARKLLWWQPTDAGPLDLARLACQVMAIGTWNDVVIARRVLGDAFFRESLLGAPPGVFDARSWNYWHRVFGIEPVPPLPRRVIP